MRGGVRLLRACVLHRRHNLLPRLLPLKAFPQKTLSLFLPILYWSDSFRHQRLVTPMDCTALNRSVHFMENSIAGSGTD